MKVKQVRLFWSGKQKGGGDGKTGRVRKQALSIHGIHWCPLHRVSHWGVLSLLTAQGPCHADLSKNLPETERNCKIHWLYIRKGSRRNVCATERGKEEGKKRNWNSLELKKHFRRPDEGKKREEARLPTQSSALGIKCSLSLHFSILLLPISFLPFCLAILSVRDLHIGTSCHCTESVFSMITLLLQVRKLKYTEVV